MFGEKHCHQFCILLFFHALDAHTSKTSLSDVTKAVMDVRISR